MKGDFVGLLLPNCPHYVIAYFAALKLGAVVVNFSPLCSHDELKQQVEDSGVELMVTLQLKSLLPNAEKLLGTSKLKKLVVGTLDEVLPFPTNHLFKLFKRKEIAKFPKEHAVRWADVLAHEPLSAPEKIKPESDLAAMQYTGGTTGAPKGAMLSHQNLYANAMQAAMWNKVDPRGEGRTLAVLPFFHIFAMTAVMNATIAQGGCMIMHPRFELIKVLKDIDKKKPTVMPGVPTMFNAMLRYGKIDNYDLTSLKACVSGGAPLPVEVKAQFEERTGCKVVEGYGLTEASPIVCVNPVFGVNKAGSIGMPIPNTAVHIEDMENPGHFLPVGEVGELCVEGPQVMMGYWGREDATREVIPEDGILRTGDIAKMDEEGYVFIVDRKKEMIITAGFNVYPRNVEEALYKHDAVAEAAVIGVDHELKGQAVKAFIALKPGKQVNEDELRRFMRQTVAKYEVPSVYEFMDELPKTMIGKIDKKGLR